LINARRIEILDDRRLSNQLLGLERRVARGTGRDLIDHPPGSNANAHDDVANVCAGVASVLQSASSYWDGDLAWVSGPEDAPPPLGPELDPQGQSVWRNHPFFGGFQW
jgi:hypothetical protein